MSTLKVNNLQDLGADAVVTNGVIASSALPAGSILQVVSTTKTDTFSTTASSFQDITGLSATITPRSASSKILIMASVVGSSNTTSVPVNIKISGGNSDNYKGDFYSANIVRAVAGSTQLNSESMQAWPLLFLDSPSTTASTTYQVQIYADSSFVAYVNRSASVPNNTDITVGASTITVMEVAG